MATTRIKVGTSASVYHRHAVSGDAPVSDVYTSESLATGLGSSSDFELLNNVCLNIVNETTYISKVASSTGETAMTATASPKLLWIKHSGYQEATKATASTATTSVMIGVGVAASNGFISLYPNQSIVLTAPFGSNIDNVDDIDMITSASEAVYVEAKVMVD